MKENTEYKITKAPAELLVKTRKRLAFPIEKLKVGEMFEAKLSQKMSVYNAIKHRRNYTKECSGWIFRVATIGKDKIACVRIK